MLGHFWEGKGIARERDDYGPSPAIKSSVAARWVFRDLN